MRAEPASREGEDALWRDFLLAGTLSLVDPQGLGGVCLKARAGPLRDFWLERFLLSMQPRVPRIRLPAAIPPDRLLGEIDVAATLATGRPVLDTGALLQADGGCIVIAMAERLPPPTAAIVSSAMDEGAVRIERSGFSHRMPTRFATIALDEGSGDEECLPDVLAERLAFHVELDRLTSLPTEFEDAADADAIMVARSRLSDVAVSEEMLAGLAALSDRGRGTARAALHLLRAARAIAAMRGAGAIDIADAAAAVRLVIGGAALAPSEEGRQEQSPTPAEGNQAEPLPESDEGAGTQVADLILEAVVASIPAGLLEAVSRERQAPGRAGAAGKSGRAAQGAARGRPLGARRRPPHPGARIDVIATLRSAAPWQRLRRTAVPGADAPEMTGRLHLRGEDLRYVHRRQKTGTTAIFAVDASGSAAVARLAETKGAIELLLSECYVRRDQVALIGFRGERAELLLTPTRSLVRAKRCLAALPGGGGTPLADGIVRTTALASLLRRGGQDVVSVFLTDGRANVSLEGARARDAAVRDAEVAARRFRAQAFRGIVIDTARQPQPTLRRLAEELGAEYLPLPRGGARGISRAVGSRLEKRDDPR
jgi:magnesium chelatase subunit D